MTTAISADVNLGKSDFNDKAYVGLGILFFNDIGGDSKFGNQTGSITLSGILPMGSGHMLSLGIQGGLGMRKADLSSVTFRSQWDGTTFDPTLYSGEQNTLTSFSYMDASAGLLYVYDGGQSSFARVNDTKFKFGFAGYHLNKPLMEYVSGSGDRLHRKYVIHAAFETDFPGRPLGMEVNAIQFIQGGHYETLFGAILKYRFESATKITGHSQDAFVGLGCFMRWNDAIIPSLMIKWRGLQFGTSYDITISELRRAYGGGSLEFSLSYTNLDHSLFKTRKRRF